MPIPLKFDLIKAIVQHGAMAGPNNTTDPSKSPELRQAGLAMVTAYLEQMSLLNLIHNPVPFYDSQGARWIGYSLTETGMELAQDEQALRQAVADLTGDARHEVSQSVKDLREECGRAAINENYKEDFLQTLDEIAICFDDKCYIAAIGLSGKILEVCLKEILIRHNVEFEPNLMIGLLIKRIKEKVPTAYIHPALESTAQIISKSRNTAVHANERIPIPSRDQTVMVIYAMRDVVRRNLSHVTE